ncbi:hypothetical protein [Fictibacillus terranigra]|uniref:Uncharacterized protein n=1 Tax=Fictibacillus terranigra TaxID=3058424 RepID=A0ABT8EEE8_9BACL|nr:hypothetical protein [Fictibacillus sp. CENA-BCM004]MDN4076293.1 hypothetical protein [Fictibacillus sp. CENA-BCM004]
MLIGDIMKHLENGGELKKLSTEQGNTSGLMSYRRLTAAMKTAGYEHVNKGGNEINWKYAGEGEAPTHKSIFDYDQRQSNTITPKQRMNKKRATHEDEINNVLITHKDEMNKKSLTQEATPAPRKELTVAELNDIRAMLQEWKNHKDTSVAATLEDTVKPLHLRIYEEIKAEDKVRKTLSLNKSVGQALDQFATSRKLNKQDIIELALWDLFKKYK